MRELASRKEGGGELESTRSAQQSSTISACPEFLREQDSLQTIVAKPGRAILSMQACFHASALARGQRRRKCRSGQQISTLASLATSVLHQPAGRGA